MHQQSAHISKQGVNEIIRFFLTGEVLPIVTTFVRYISSRRTLSAAVVAPFFNHPLITRNFSCHFSRYRNCLFYHFRPRWFPKRIPKTSTFITSVLFSTETRWSRYDHIFTLRMNTCFSHLFHNWFSNGHATNTLTTSTEITMAIMVIRPVLLLISTYAAKRNE